MNSIATLEPLKTDYNGKIGEKPGSSSAFSSIGKQFSSIGKRKTVPSKFSNYGIPQVSAISRDLFRSQNISLVYEGNITAFPSPTSLYFRSFPTSMAISMGLTALTIRFPLFTLHIYYKNAAN